MLADSPSITSWGRNVTLVANYVNTGTVAMTVNVYFVVTYSNGTIWNEGYLFYPQGHLILPKEQLYVSVNIGPLDPGTYSLSFFVQQDITKRQVSQTTELQVTIL